MGTTQPIRDKQTLLNFKAYYSIHKPNTRNYALIIVGLNTALRISDILSLTYDSVYKNEDVRNYLVIKEQKTGKINKVLLNYETRRVLEKYRDELVQTKMHKSGNPYLFPSPQKADAPLSRHQAYRIVTAAADAAGLDECVSCHSLRKTFGYHAWKQGADPVVIMMIFNHSSFTITMRYLCIEQDDKDNVYRTIYQDCNT